MRLERADISRPRNRHRGYLITLGLMVFVSRYSPLRHTRPLIYALGALAIGLEVIRKVMTLTREPFVTVSVVMGAASGYTLVGMLGGLLLTALPPEAASPGLNVAVAPALMTASFTMLTTIGTTVLQTRNLASWLWPS
jgi:hypothetical protein